MLAPLFEQLGQDDEDLAKEALRALGKRGPAALREAVHLFDTAQAPLSRRLCRLLGRLGGQAEGQDEALREAARQGLLRVLGDGDERLRRAAISALGRFRDSEVEAALIREWERGPALDSAQGSGTPSIETRRALAEALGKVGGQRALALLREVQTDNAELRRLTDQAILTLERETGRPAAAAALQLERAPAAPLKLALRCRAGLEELLAAELPAALRAQVRGPGLVEAVLAAGMPLSGLFRSRLWLRLGFVLEGAALGPDEDEAAALAALLTGPEGRAIFATFTQGPARFRLDFAAGGHRRALVWRCAGLVRERTAEILNDPTQSLWEAVVCAAVAPGGATAAPGGAAGPALRIELCPRLRQDPRFAYRQGDVPAASHPTLAAALARVGGVQREDVVWDPFVGSGLELIERALLGPYAALHGTDVDRRALAVAERNLRAAGFTDARLSAGDARRFEPRPGPPTLILTNPPMGRRVLPGQDLEPLFGAFLSHAARILAPGGRLVWYSPLPAFTARRALQAGLRQTLRSQVDLGGFPADLQAFIKPR